jgi:hypothetical protein
MYRNTVINMKDLEYYDHLGIAKPMESLNVKCSVARERVVK